MWSALLLKADTFVPKQIWGDQTHDKGKHSRSYSAQLQQSSSAVDSILDECGTTRSAAIRFVD